MEYASALEDNNLVAATENVTSDGSQYCLANKGNGVGFYLVGEGVTIPAGKAYLQVAAPVKAFYGFGLDDDPTGISTAAEDEAEPVYNLAGQRFSKMQKGVNIVEGKKIIK